MTDTPNPFQSLAACLGEGERLRLELHREGEALAVLVQPVLNAAPPSLDAERQRLRVALAYPLRLTGTAAQLDRDLVAALVAYGAKRQEVRAAACDLAYWAGVRDALEAFAIGQGLLIGAVQANDRAG